MYQFPDADEVMGNHEPKPLNKGNRYKVIIIGNLLLAFFIVLGVWFLFFLNSPPNNIVVGSGSPLAIDDKDDQALIGAFTPIIIDDEQQVPVTSQVKEQDILTITDTVHNKPIESIASHTAEIKKISFNKTNPKEEINKEAMKNNLASSQLSAIDLIANELMKNKQAETKHKQLQSSTIKPIDTPEKDSATIGTPLKIDAKKTALATEKKRLAENQVIIEHATEKSLARLIEENKKNIKSEDKLLINKLHQDHNNNYQIKTTNYNSLYNSVPLKETSDIDKIMAAMGSVKRTVETNTFDKIENKVKKLLKNEENRKTDAYIAKLLPEIVENKKEIRTITVKKNEKLWDIAVRAYGDGSKYKKILEANPLLKKNPKLLKEGITLRAPL